MGGKQIRFVGSVAEAKASDVPAIVIPPSEGKLPATYASDFWCYPMFRSISESMGKPVPIGTLGLCIDAESPLLRGFTREEYTTPAWYQLIQTAHCEPIEVGQRPTSESDCLQSPSVASTQPRAEGWPIQMIDNTERCQRLALMWEQEGVLHMTFRLWEGNPDDVTVRAFAASLVEAMA